MVEVYEGELEVMRGWKGSDTKLKEDSVLILLTLTHIVE